MGKCAPRVSGDEPVETKKATNSDGCSPRERG